MAKKAPKTIKIEYFRRMIGRPEKHRKVLRGLGFRRLNQVVERQDTPAVRGMVAKVCHLVRIVEGE